MKKLGLLISALMLASSAGATPSVEVTDIQAKRVDLATDAFIHDYCLFGKNEENVNTIVCSQMIGDLNKGIYKVETGPLEFNSADISFRLSVDSTGFSTGELRYVFVETKVDNPMMKPSEKFFDQVKTVIAKHGAARLKMFYIGEGFDTSLFGTPVPFF